MEHLPKMIDMANTDAKEMPMMMGGMNQPKYPYGLCICLTGEELDKLGLDGDCEVGDMLYMHSLAVVTSVSKRQGADGKDECRVELQITHISAEDEDEENEENDSY